MVPERAPADDGWHGISSRRRHQSRSHPARLDPRRDRRCRRPVVRDRRRERRLGVAGPLPRRDRSRSRCRLAGPGGDGVVEPSSAAGNRCAPRSGAAAALALRAPAGRRRLAGRRPPADHRQHRRPVRSRRLAVATGPRCVGSRHNWAAICDGFRHGARPDTYRATRRTAHHDTPLRCSGHDEDQDAPRLHRVRHGAPEVVGPMRGVRRVEHARRGGGRRHPSRDDPRRPMAELQLLHDIDALLGRGAADRHRRARPGARRWARARLGHPARRRAGHRQEHAAAAAARLVAGADAVRQRRGEPAAGAHPRRAPRRGASRVVAGGRDVARRDRRRDRPLAARGSSSSTASRRLPTTDQLAAPGRWSRSGRAPSGSPSRRSSVASPWCSSATSPRTARSPVPGCSSTSSTPCCPSRATATTRCACCERSSTASARPTSWGCSR